MGAIMKRVVCVVALGLSLGACESVGPDYGAYGYGGGNGHYARQQKCYEVQNSFSRPYVECRYVKRWKPEPRYRYEPRSEPRYRDRDDDEYSYRESKRRWRDKEYYD